MTEPLGNVVITVLNMAGVEHGEWWSTEMNHWGRQKYATGSVFIFLVLIQITGTFAHPDHHEDRLLSHFVIGGHAIQNGSVADQTHSFVAKLIGAPKVVTLGPTTALAFNGKTDWLQLASSLEAAMPKLPSKEFSVTAWVSLNQTTHYGGICGVIQDNGNYEKGWLLGYNDTTFSFTLSTKGADDGDGKLTTLPARTEIEPGRWYHVAATYDGTTMRLYVNGKLESESKLQSGEILYPPQGAYAIGAYVDDDEKYPLDGAIYEVKTYRRVMSTDEIAAIATKNENLLKYQPPITTELDFLVKPYLQMGTQSSMTIMCETTRPARIRVNYAQRQPLEKHAQNSEFRRISELTLTNLEPHTSYFYRVTCEDEAGKSVQSDLYSLQTAPPPERPWAFSIIGDTQRNPAVTRKCMEGAYELRPNFLLHCGDVVDDGHAKNQWVKDLFEPSALLMSHIPTFPVIGNHEKNSHWYYDYFSLPTPEYFYTFQYGNAQFFMIDSNKPLGPQSEQYLWLEKQLAASKATWKFTCHHHPCFTSDADDYGDHLKGEKPRPITWGEPNAQKLVPLYEKYGVDISFNGHIHAYERTWPIWQMTINQKKGVRYVTSGGGGGHLEIPAPQRAWFSLHFKRAHHFCYVTLHDRTIQLKAYDIEGRLFDTFELTKPGDR